MTTPDPLLIRDFLINHISLAEFCFVLEHRLNSQYGYKFLAGETLNQKIIALIELAQQRAEVGDLVHHIIYYWLNDIHGNPRVLNDEGMIDPLAIEKPKQPTETRNGKPVIRYFVSYAHDDQELKDKLLKLLKQRLAIDKDYCFEDWDDRKILPGDPWHETIQQAVAACQFGLLLVSPAFLGSQYIQDHELRSFVTSNLKTAKPEKRAIPVALEPILFDNMDLQGLEKLQIFRDSKGRSFSECGEDTACKNFALELFQKIHEIAGRHGAHVRGVESLGEGQ